MQERSKKIESFRYIPFITQLRLVWAEIQFHIQRPGENKVFLIMETLFVFLNVQL